MASGSQPDRAERGTDAWVLATLPRALAFAHSLLKDRSLAEDVAHDCYARLLAQGERYDLPNDGTRLLYKAITNACIDRNYRDRKLLSLEYEGDDGAQLDVPDTRAEGPAEKVARKELEGAVNEALAQLSVAQRGAIELKSLGHSLEEIADALGTTPGNAGVILHRARKALADRLRRFLGGPDHDPA